MTDFSISVTITPPGALSPSALDRALPRALARVGALLEAAAKDNLQDHVVTGRLRSSLTTRVGPRSVTVGTRTDYARYVEDGTKPHVIRPKNKKALAWRTGGAGSKGGMAFAKVVHHPGTKPVHYMRNALKDNSGKVARIVSDEIVKELKGQGK